MFKTFKTILFATNLQENCKPAFDFAVSIATKYQATIVLLHVLESEIPDYAENLVKGVLGEDEWEKIWQDREKNARQSLIAKRSSDELIRRALDQFCTNAGIDDASCGYHSREIVLGSGEVIEEIMDQSKKYHADMIVLGAREGYFSKDTAISHVIRGVLHRTRIPVVVVPPRVEAT